MDRKKPIVIRINSFSIYESKPKQFIKKRKPKPHYRQIEQRKRKF